MKKSRILPLFFGFVLCLTTVASCQEPNEYITDSAGDRVKVKKIKFLHIWPECNKQLIKIVNDFMTDNPDIKIEIVQSDYLNVSSYLNSQVLSSSVPDVFFYWTNQINGYAQNDVCLALDDYMDGWSTTFINNGEAWDLGKVKNKHYSMPFRATAEVVVYNKTLFEENNIAVPTSIESFEDTLASLRKLTNSTKFAPFALTGISGGTLIQLYTAFQNFGELQLESYKDPNYSTGLLMNTEENRTLEGKMLDKIKDWYEKGYFGQADGKTKDTSIRNFMDGDAAMLLLNYNNLDLLAEMNEDIEIGFTNIPSPSGYDYTYLHSDFDGFSVYKYSKYPEACIRFLKYLSSKEVAETFANETNSIMAIDNIEYTTKQNQEVSEVMKDCGKSIFIRNDVQYSTSNISSQNDEDILDYVLGRGKATGKDVADTIWQRYLTAMADANLKPIEYSIELKNADFSWLDIRK